VRVRHRSSDLRSDAYSPAVRREEDSFEQRIAGGQGDTVTVDGSVLNFHEVAHLNVSASGITFSFEKPRCG
jgi:hypothetical protein